MKSKTLILPPYVATKLLHTFLRDELAEEVSGDLEEKFYLTVRSNSLLYAKWNYWYQVLQYMRPFAIRKSKSTTLNHRDMFKNYFKVGFRNLINNKGYSIINIGGLAVGMTIAILVGLWVYDELSYDHYHENFAAIMQVQQHATFNGVKGTGVAIPRPLEAVLRNDYGSDFKYISMSTWTGDRILSQGDVKITKTGNFFQKDFPEMLSLHMLSGRRDALKDPSSVLLSESTAKALFGDADPMNQSMRIDNKFDVKVAGVYEDLPYNTTFSNLKFIGSWELYITGEAWLKNALTEWGNNSFQLFVQLAPGANAEVVSQKIKTVKADHDKDQREFFPEVFLNPMHNWHLYSEWKEGKNVGGRIQMVWLFGIIGVFVLLLACINFMNLSTARSEKRAKEVGIRLSIGSVRSQLIYQFLSESFIVVTIAYLLAMGFVILALPSFSTMADKRIVIDWLNPVFWLISITFIMVTSLLAGSYPALYLSSFQPVKVLKGAFRLGRFASLPRKILVVVQFAVSVTLVIGTIIVYRQIEHTKSRPVGYQREGIIMIQMNTPDFYGKLDVLRTELKSTGAIEEISESSSPITGIWSNNGGFEWAGKDPDLQSEFNTIWVTPEYGSTLNWKIKEGRDFSREFATDSSAIILNEAAIKFMGVKEPVAGMEITWNDEKLHVIGLIEDLITQSPYEPVKQTVYLMDYNNVNWINIKLNPEKSASESLALIESVFKKNITSAPFEYKFVDEDFAKKFSAEERIGKLTSVFAVLAVLISSLGIFGLASFVAEQRTKEIGVRKVLGASVGNLWRMLSRDFVILVVISCVIAIPVACYVLFNWLQGYEYHTEISWWIPVVASVSALVLTLATVSFQAVKAALMNPVRSLRSE